MAPTSESFSPSPSAFVQTELAVEGQAHSAGSETAGKGTVRLYLCFVNRFICTTFLHSTYKWCHMIRVFLWFASLSMIVSSPSTSLLVLQSLSRVWLFDTPRTAARQASLSITNSWSLLKVQSIELVMPSNHLFLCRPLLLPSMFPNIRVFSNESALPIRWPKYWSFSAGC